MLRAVRTSIHPTPRAFCRRLKRAELQGTRQAMLDRGLDKTRLARPYCVATTRRPTIGRVQ